MLLGDSMSFFSTKWMRTHFWILTSVFVGLCTWNQYLFPSPILWIIIGSYCLLNAYIEFMVIALFIQPGPAKKSIESSEWQSHFCEYDSRTTHIQTLEQDHIAPLIVFIHGWRGSSASVLERAQWFVEKGWHVAICELPGHGKSTVVQRWNAITAAKHLQHHIKNLHIIIKQENVSHVLYYGHSMGGYVFTRISSDESNTPFNLPLTGLILESPLLLYSQILDEIRDKLKIPFALHRLHLRRVFRDVKNMHPSITSENLKQFDIPQWGVPTAPTLCLQAKTDSRLGRDHYDAAVEAFTSKCEFTHHLIESLTHSGAKTNDDRETLLLEWLRTFDSLILS